VLVFCCDIADYHIYAIPTAAAPTSEVEAVNRYPTNVATAKIATGLLALAMFVVEDLIANRRLQVLLLF